MMMAGERLARSTPRSPNQRVRSLGEGGAVFETLNVLNKQPRNHALFDV